MKPRLLDLFAGEGGSAYGWAAAGFDVTAVDDVDRAARAPGVTWVTSDATTDPLDGFDAVAGSPPCTDRTTLANAARPQRGGDTGTAWMLPHTIARFQAWAARTGGLWVVENVTGARRDMPSPMKLCGSMFGLTDEGWLLRRHRYFSSNAPPPRPGGLSVPRRAGDRGVRRADAERPPVRRQERRQRRHARERRTGAAVDGHAVGVGDRPVPGDPAGLHPVHRRAVDVLPAFGGCCMTIRNHRSPAGAS